MVGQDYWRWGEKSDVTIHLIMIKNMISENLPEQIVPFVRQETFHVANLIGRGGFGKVFKMVHPLDNVMYAVKRISLSSDNWQKAISEIRILARIEHSHIVRYYHSWIDSSTDNTTPEDSEDEDDDEKRLVHAGHRFFFCIQMEFCPINLREFLRQQGQALSTGHMQCLFRQLVDGLCYLHERHIIHRDIKPENLLLKDPFHLKISDFGLATWIDANHTFLRRTLYGGTFLYSPPEQYEDGIIGFPTDIYSAGIILYELGCYFHTDMERISTLQVVRKKRILLFSHRFESLILSMTSIRMGDRPTIHELHQRFCDSRVFSICRELVLELISDLCAGLCFQENNT